MVLPHEVALPSIRLRRLRQHPRLRDLVRETSLSVNDFVMPLFVKAGNNIKNPVSSMQGQFQWSVDCLHEILSLIKSASIPAVLLFGVPDHKDDQGSPAMQDHGVVQEAIRVIRSQAPDILVMVDLCFCEYTDHGHCGVVIENQLGEYIIDNDATLKLLVQQAVSLAKAGADVIAPSGMMDGMVIAIRNGLNQANYSQLPILSYAVKYASSFYGPFREAAEGVPQFGDRAAYQMDPANGSRALREAALDVEEGADLLMVKPAGPYLDILWRVKAAHPGVPIAAYQVSAEFAMIKAAAERGWIDESRVIIESLLSIKRAGADFIVTYFALEAAVLLKDN